MLTEHTSLPSVLTIKDTVLKNDSRMTERTLSVARMMKHNRLYFEYVFSGYFIKFTLITHGFEYPSISTHLVANLGKGNVKRII